MEIWLALVVLVIAAVLFKTLIRKPHRVYHYNAAPALLTNAEAVFASALEKALAPDQRMLAKVRVADVLVPRDKRDIAAFRRVSQKHLDFVIVGSDWKIAAAVELNDKSHDSARRKARDELLRQAFASAGVPLQFVRASTRYSAEALRELVFGSMSKDNRT